MIERDVIAGSSENQEPEQDASTSPSNTVAVEILESLQTRNSESRNRIGHYIIKINAAKTLIKIYKKIYIWCNPLKSGANRTKIIIPQILSYIVFYVENQPGITLKLIKTNLLGEKYKYFSEHYKKWFRGINNYFEVCFHKNVTDVRVQDIRVKAKICPGL